MSFHEMSIKNLPFFNEQQLAVLLSTPFCCYCLMAQEPFEKFTTHFMREANGEISCPKLQLDGCSNCGVTGIFAHHATDCPRNVLKLIQDSIIDSGPSIFATAVNGDMNTSNRIMSEKCEDLVNGHLREMKERFDAPKDGSADQDIKDSEEMNTKTSRRKSCNPRKRNRDSEDQPEECNESIVKRRPHAI